MQQTQQTRVSSLGTGQPASGVDQQIIDALFSGEQQPILELVRQGLTQEAVRRRGAQLGMTDGFIKKCRLSGTRPSMRKCINCDESFLSAGSHNRLCRRCPRR